MLRHTLLALMVLIPASLTISCRGTDTGKEPDRVSVDLPTKADHLEVIAAINYILEKDVDTFFNGYDREHLASFDPFSLPNLMHAKPEPRRDFTLNSKPVKPKPAEVLVNYQVDGETQTGATVKATPGHFITGVEATIDDYEGSNRVHVRAVQEDGSEPTITYP